MQWYQHSDPGIFLTNIYIFSNLREDLIQTFDEGSIPSSKEESYTERYGKDLMSLLGESFFQDDQSMYTKKRQNEDEIRFVFFFF
jgi:hypothetical protein